MKEPIRSHAGSNLSRRQALGLMTATAASFAASFPLDSLVQETDLPVLRANLKPLFELSPFLYMQFMEPLGTTDGSVEAAWDHLRDRWRPDVTSATRDLAPTMLRWGGIFLDFYRWREGVGPRP